MAVRRILCLAAVAALMLSSCIYPFEPGIETSDSRIVVEGSVSIGGTSEFSFSRVFPFTSNGYDMPAMEMTGYIEGEDGSRIEARRVMDEESSQAYAATRDKVDGSEPAYSPLASLVFDTSNASPSQRYRVHFKELITGAEYESDWLEVCVQPTIDELRYILDYDRHELNVALSMHCPSHTHFRWRYDETWEYHSDLYATQYFVYEDMFDKSDGSYHPERGIHNYVSPTNTYYCWSTVRSPEVKIFSTTEQVENRFTDLEFHRVSSSNKKLQLLYRLTVYLEAISENAYLYWKNIDDNTTNQGSIFSPIPSQMAGNIHCLTDPSAEVIGYVNASQVAVGIMYYDDRLEGFYNGPGVDWATLPLEVFSDPAYFYNLYRNGYLPYTYDKDEGTYYWSKARCVDCRLGGGTKERPEDWPNTDV